MTAALIFAVAEAVFFLPAMSGFINSMASFGLRYGKDAGFYVPVSKSKLKKAERIEKEISSLSDREKKEKLERKKASLLRPSTANALKVLTIIAFLVRTAVSIAFCPITEGKTAWIISVASGSQRDFMSG